MGFVLIRFAEPADVATVRQDLGTVDAVELSGDWHEHRFSTMARHSAETGNGTTSAPFQSLANDRSRTGRTELLIVRMTSGKKIMGQLRPSGILLSDGGVDRTSLGNDENIRAFVSALQSRRPDCRVEIG